MSLLLLVIGIILFIGLVIVHEFGHFLSARRNGVEVEEFGIFFPPRLFKKKMKSGFIFSINLLPLGGFVKLKGEHDSDIGKGTFGAASLWSKSKIMLAGVFMNLITALVLLTVISLIGMPQLIHNQFQIKSDSKVSSRSIYLNYVDPGSPAAKAGLKANDQILAIGLQGRSLTYVYKDNVLPKLTKEYAGQTVVILYKTTNSIIKKTTTTLLSNQVVENSQLAYEKSYKKAKVCQVVQPPKGYLGVIPVSYQTNRSTWSAPIVAVGLSAQATQLTFKGIGNALYGLGSIIAGFITNNKTARQNGECSASSQVNGPVGIFFILKQSSVMGYQFLLTIIALISLTLAIMNILPIPALDGGRFWIILISRIIKKPLSQKAEEIINAIGFILLILLIILITNVDINRFF